MINFTLKFKISIFILTIKYKKTSFSNPGHAHNLAEKLNTLFKTDRYKVYLLTNGQVITENSN